MANLEVLRKFMVGRGPISPPRSTATTCEDPSEPVVLELGKGAAGKVVEISAQSDVTGYMTKQQKEEQG